jgi:hypothetical protein
MLLILFAGIIFVFLQLGSAMFVACLAIRTLRSYALSTALWFAAVGPAVVVALTLAGTALVAQTFTTSNKDFPRFHLPAIPKAMWTGYFIVCVLAVMLASSAISWLHQFLIHRVTYPLFRIYAMLVCAGMGSVWALSASLTLTNFQIPHAPLIALFAAVALCAGFGYLGFRLARQLRGDPPERLTWITPEEFKGTMTQPQTR